MVEGRKQAFAQFCGQLKERYPREEDDQIDIKGNIIKTGEPISLEDHVTLQEATRDINATNFHFNMVVQYIQEKYELEPKDRLGPNGEIVTENMVMSRLENIIVNLPSDHPYAEVEANDPEVNMVKRVRQEAIEAMAEVES